MDFFKRHAALWLAVFFCGIIFFTLNDYGVTWDEGVYFKAGESYFEWLRNPSFKTIDTYWELNHEHPPLTKVLGGMTKYLFNEKLPFLNNLSSFRLYILFFVFLANYFLFKFVAELINYKVALLTTAIFFFLPRVFFHSHIGAMDYPVTTLWFAVIYCLWKGVKNGRWILLASVLFGLALLTKINAFFLYIPILFYWALNNQRQLKMLLGSYPPAKNKEALRSFYQVIPLFIIPPIMFIAFWPWLWKDPLPRVSEFLSFHGYHALVYTYYWGTQYPLAPWHYPFILTIITLPMLVLFLFLVGLTRLIFQPDKTKIFILFNALFPLLLIAIPSVPKYDGVRLFSPAFPFISMIAGMGLHQIFIFKAKKLGNLFLILYMGAFLATIHPSIIKIHPFQSSYFNEFIGGVDGAVKKGFEVEYWGNAYIGVLPWMNQHPQSTFWIYMADLEPKVLWGFDLYKKNGLLNKSIKFGDKNDSDYLVLLIRQGFFNEEMWEYYKSKEPVFSVTLSKTNLVNIYKMK